jgi:hypothetical protein
MPCLLALLAVFFPRVVIVLLVIFTDWLGRAYDTLLWPLLGFFFLPFTTLAYALAINQQGNVDGLYLIVVVAAVLMDIGAWSSGPAARD